MKRKFLVLLGSMIILPGLLAACTSAKVTPEIKPEPEIPADYSTYTSEGLFSISYPPDWTPMTSIMDELMETSKELMEITDPELEMDDIEMLFFGGLPIDDGNFLPNVSICVTARGFGYWDLDEIVYVETLYSKETTHGYREYSRIETVVDGNKAVIIDSEDNDPPDMGYYRYLQLFLVKGDFLWLVTTAGLSEEFNNYENTFYSIVRSLRILN